MENILKQLYGHFYQAPKNTPQAKQIEANHRLLIGRLSKRSCRLVLQIINDKDQICKDVSLDSFIYVSGWRGGLLIKYKAMAGYSDTAKGLNQTSVLYYQKNLL